MATSSTKVAATLNGRGAGLSAGSVIAHSCQATTSSSGSATARSRPAPGMRPAGAAGVAEGVAAVRLMVRLARVMPVPFRRPTA